MAIIRKYSLFGISALPFRMVFLMWLLYTIGYQENLDFSFLSVKPRTLAGFPAIITAPLVHANLWHLVSNSVPLLFLGTCLFFFYESVGNQIFWRCYLIPYALVWLLGPRVAYHMGASGVIYGLAFFLIAFGLLKRDIASVLLSLVVLCLYGGMLFTGLLPGWPGVSWETHLAGGLTGLLSAIQLHINENKN
ncbi:MAG: rhomboid family intramembrane serine protease [Cyclobacteriaceae bacterium]